MTYPQVVDWLFSQLANYHKQGATAYKPGLDNISNLLSAIGNPHITDKNDKKSFKSIHIAGTNGKGSTAHMLAGMVIENGYKVGLFTSPHIKDFRERITINGRMIEESFVVDFVTQNRPVFETLNPSFFEITTAMAFTAFTAHNCDYAIVETGLGGRLDATNVLNPEIAVITNIGLDHTEFLGDTLALIASEKAGIIKQHTPVVIGEILRETENTFHQIAANLSAPLHRPDKKQFDLDLIGAYQQENAALAWQSIQILKRKGHYFDDQKSTAALTRVHQLTGFTGRLTQIATTPNILVDASHNPAGIQTLMNEIKLIPHQKLHCIYATATDKNYAESMRLFPQNAKYYFTTFESSRAVKPELLADIGNRLALHFSLHPDSTSALDAAKNSADSKDLIIVFGSFYLLEKII